MLLFSILQNTQFDVCELIFLSFCCTLHVFVCVLDFLSEHFLHIQHGPLYSVWEDPPAWQKVKLLRHKRRLFFQQIGSRLHKLDRQTKHREQRQHKRCRQRFKGKKQGTNWEAVGKQHHEHTNKLAAEKWEAKNKHACTFQPSEVKKMFLQSIYLNGNIGAMKPAILKGSAVVVHTAAFDIVWLLLHIEEVLWHTHKVRIHALQSMFHAGLWKTHIWVHTVFSMLISR